MSDIKYLAVYPDLANSFSSLKHTYALNEKEYKWKNCFRMIYRYMIYS